MTPTVNIARRGYEFEFTCLVKPVVNSMAERSSNPEANFLEESSGSIRNSATVRATSKDMKAEAICMPGHTLGERSDLRIKLKDSHRDLRPIPNANLLGSSVSVVKCLSGLKESGEGYISGLWSSDLACALVI